MGETSSPESDAEPEPPPLSLTQPSELAPGDTPAAAVDNRSSAKRVEAKPTAVPEEPQLSVAWDPESQGQPGPDPEHLLFVPTHQGYLLLRRSGPAPALGEVLSLPEIPGARLVVTKVALSPLPRDRRVCAYLNDL
jgi:hypothetical protein